MRPGTLKRVVVALIVLTIAATACGDDDGEAAATTTAVTSSSTMDMTSSTVGFPASATLRVRGVPRTLTANRHRCDSSPAPQLADSGRSLGSASQDGAGSESRLRRTALVATMKLEPDIDRAAHSGRSTQPSAG